MRPNALTPLPFLATAFLTLGLLTAAQAKEITWTKHVVAEKTTGANSINASDFDGDGHMDLISSHNGQVVAYRGPDFKPVSVHRFLPLKPGQNARGGCIHACLLDVDQDGDMDFIGSNKTVFWLECPDNPFDGHPWKYRNIDNEIKGTHCLITGDVDGDGTLDLIANSFATADKTKIPESITWQKVPADPKTAPNWERHVFAKGDAPGGNHYMGFGDVNKDGRPDIACGAKGGPGFVGGEWFAWWEQGKDATKPWKKHMLSDTEPGATCIIPVDLDADGHVDYVASRGHGKGVLQFKGPDFKKIDIDPTINRPHCLVVGDIDADGDPDFATCGSLKDGVAAWYENDKGTFTKHVIGTDTSSYDIRLIDLDNDKDLDVLIAGHADANIVWFEQP